MKQSEYLGHVRAVVAKGWHQGSATDMRGNWCSIGALSLAAVEACAGEWYGPTLRLLDDRCREQGFRYLMAFNDHPSTTKQDVLNFLDKTILGLEERGE